MPQPAHPAKQQVTVPEASSEAVQAHRNLQVRVIAAFWSGTGCWRTLDGLAGFAVIQSYLSTATKWGITRIDALRGLFNGHPWMPTGLEPATG